MERIESLQSSNSGVASEVSQPNESESKSGIKPTFRTDDFVLYNGDCLAVMDKFPDNYVDMIFADLPYLLSNDGFTHRLKEGLNS